MKIKNVTGTLSGIIPLKYIKMKENVQILSIHLKYEVVCHFKNKGKINKMI